jgi:hypothetical protein
MVRKLHQNGFGRRPVGAINSQSAVAIAEFALELRRGRAKRGCPGLKDAPGNVPGRGSLLFLDQRTRDDVGDIARKLWRTTDPTQRRGGERSPLRLKDAPALER